MRGGFVGDEFKVKRCAMRLSRTSTAYAVTIFVTTSILPRTDFEYGQI